MSRPGKRSRQDSKPLGDGVANSATVGPAGSSHFHLIDLISQCFAVERVLAGLDEDEMVSWVASRGDLTRVPKFRPDDEAFRRQRQLCRFVSTLNLECVFFIDDGQFVFLGDHSTFRPIGHIKDL